MRRIEAPQERTSVAYIYKDIHSHKKIKFKEILLNELKSRYSGVELSELLKPNILKQIFLRN